MRVRDRVGNIGHSDALNVGLAVGLGLALQLVDAVLLASVLGGGADDAAGGEVRFDVFFLLTGWVDLNRSYCLFF